MKWVSTVQEPGPVDQFFLLVCVLTGFLFSGLFFTSCGASDFSWADLLSGDDFFLSLALIGPLLLLAP